MSALLDTAAHPAGIMDKLNQGRDLDRAEAAGLMRAMLAGEWSDACVGAALLALNLKGVSVTELSAFVEVCREIAVRIRPRVDGLIDTCGTGGDGARTFNISTAAAFVVAGCGVPVAKHGNRSVSSGCGSADVLERLGVCLQLTPGQVERCIEETGIGFLFAPAHHPAFRRVGQIRRELRVRTVFNLMGPLLNPADVSAQLVGVYDPDKTELMAATLRDAGLRRAMVVHGGGLDELALHAPGKISRLLDGRIETGFLDPAELGLTPARPAELAVDGPAESASAVLAVLSGEKSPRREIVLLNAAAALVTAGLAGGFAEGLALAAASVDDGRAIDRFEQLRRFSHDPGPDSGR